MLKNNIWNCIFHHSELEAQEDKYFEYQKLIRLGPETLQHIQLAQDLDHLLTAHKLAWGRGYQNENIGPCEYGMFRTEDIANMLSSEVYLGNIYGLWTFNIPFWNAHSNDLMAGNGFGIPDETKVYDIIMQQYRRILRSNVEAIIRKAKDYCKQFDEEV